MAWQEKQRRIHPLPFRVNNSIREYLDRPEYADEHEWVSRHEIPSSAEVLDNDGDGSQSSAPIELNPNNVDGAWESKDNYLGTMYELLREDALQPLREAVSQVRQSPNANEDAFMDSKIRVGIYGNVHICGLTASRRGVAVKVTFSLARIGKRILWKQSKRLLTGGLVVLSPKTDLFQRKAIVAIVAARPTESLERDPPEIDLFFARTEELEIDPAVEYVMVEERSSFYEAQRHTLRALQQMMQEPFPLSEHLVGVQADIPAPSYVQQRPEMDLSAVLDVSEPGMCKMFNVLEGLPADCQSELDASQLKALQRILTKQLAIVQGPPGTGKTFVSVQAIKVMLASQEVGAPPIIVACQTNHAVDQLLRHIHDFEADFVRLGGMSKDREVIKPRTLFEVRNAEGNDVTSPTVGRAFKGMTTIQKEIKVALHPMRSTEKALDHRELERLDIISKTQADSLEAGAAKWAIRGDGESSAQLSPFMPWLGEKLVAVPPKQRQENHMFEYEETELAYEHLRELEAEAIGGDEDNAKDTLTGEYYELADNLTCRRPPGGQPNIQNLLKEQDLWKIPLGRRGTLYRHFQMELKKSIRDEIRQKAKQYNKFVAQRQIGRWEEDETILKTQKVIGMTTTGLSKYRALLSALQPRIVLIEEAAETLEPPVTVACLPSVQHLILVGDHRQLRPHTKLHKAFKLDISLFERMIMNNIAHSMLNKQRRMIPEIRRLLYPIYGNGIEDHPFVTDTANRPDVLGMGGINSYFFTHQWPDQRDELMSAVNPMEADMVARFVWYLFDNGAELRNITILTFYNGQRKRLIRALRETSSSSPIDQIRVATVDSYQGEENDIVILSLARSNEKGDIGFLGIDNRVCVALSRAKCGFYIFGNADLLYNSKSKTWKMVIGILLGKEEAVVQCSKPQVRLSRELPICCQNHHTWMGLSTFEDWEGIHGGCREPCSYVRPCSHPCISNCHAWSHEEWQCDTCEKEEEARFYGREACSGAYADQTAVKAGPLDECVAVATQQGSVNDMAESVVVFGGPDTDYAACFEKGVDETHMMVWTNLDAIDSLPLSQQMPALRIQLSELQHAYAGAATCGWQRAITVWSEKFDAVSRKMGMSNSSDDIPDCSRSKVVGKNPSRDRTYEDLRPCQGNMLIDIELELGISKGDVAKDWSREQSLLD